MFLSETLTSVSFMVGREAKFVEMDKWTFIGQNEFRIHWAVNEFFSKYFHFPLIHHGENLNSSSNISQQCSIPDYAISRKGRVFFFTTGGLWWSHGEGIWIFSFCASQEKKSWRDVISPHYLNHHWSCETALLQHFQVCSWRNADLQARSCNSYLLSPILNKCSTTFFSKKGESLAWCTFQKGEFLLRTPNCS